MCRLSLTSGLVPPTRLEFPLLDPQVAREPPQHPVTISSPGSSDQRSLSPSALPRATNDEQSHVRIGVFSARDELVWSRPGLVSHYLGGQNGDVHHAVEVGLDSGDDPVSVSSPDRVSHPRHVRSPVELGIPVRVPEDECLAGHASSPSARPGSFACSPSSAATLVAAGRYARQQPVPRPPAVSPPPDACRSP